MHRAQLPLDIDDHVAGVVDDEVLTDGGHSEGGVVVDVFDQSGVVVVLAGVEEDEVVHHRLLVEVQDDGEGVVAAHARGTQGEVAGVLPGAEVGDGDLDVAHVCSP